MRLISTTIGGNCHEAVIAINKLNLARFVLCMERAGSNYTNVVFRTCGPDEWHFVRKVLGQTEREYDE